VSDDRRNQEMTSISKSAGEEHVAELAAQVHDGGMLRLRGPAGSGKTKLANFILRYLEPHIEMVCTLPYHGDRAHLTEGLPGHLITHLSEDGGAGYVTAMITERLLQRPTEINMLVVVMDANDIKMLPDLRDLSVKLAQHGKDWHVMLLVIDDCDHGAEQQCENDVDKPDDH